VSKNPHGQHGSLLSGSANWHNIVKVASSLSGS